MTFKKKKKYIYIYIYGVQSACFVTHIWVTQFSVHGPRCDSDYVLLNKIKNIYIFG